VTGGGGRISLSFASIVLVFEPSRDRRLVLGGRSLKQEERTFIAFLHRVSKLLPARELLKNSFFELVALAQRQEVILSDTLSARNFLMRLLLLRAALRLREKVMG